SRQPVDLAEQKAGLGQCGSRTDDDSTLLRIDPQHIERLIGSDPQSPALADGEMGDAAMAADNTPVAIHNVARLAGLGPQPLDKTGIGSVGDKADVLAVGLLG